MRIALLFFVVFWFFGCNALRVLNIDTDPRLSVDEQLDAMLAPQRHIVYSAKWHAGISDILEQFTWLVHLGKKWNATVHLKQGTNPSDWLGKKHSKCIADDWSDYFDTAANQGNPWHAVDSSLQCRVINDTTTDLNNLFADNEKCIDIHIVYWRIDGHMEGHEYSREFSTRMFHSSWTAIPPSPMIINRAAAFRRKHNISNVFSTVHIRQCDKNSKCNDVDDICSELLNRPEIQTWMISTYAEEDYRQQLVKRLATLGKHIVFEEESCDNYATYLTNSYLNGMAKGIIDTKWCTGYVENSKLTQQNTLNARKQQQLCNPGLTNLLL